MAAECLLLSSQIEKREESEEGDDDDGSRQSRQQRMSQTPGDGDGRQTRKQADRQSQAERETGKK